MKGILSSYRVHIWRGKTRMAALQSGVGRMMIDSVVWTQYIKVTDTQAATSPYQMPRQRTGVERQKRAKVTRRRTHRIH